MSLSRVPIFLGIAGAVPFVVSILGFVYTQDYPKALSQHAFMIYSLAILCFLAGTTWGVVLNRPEAERVWSLLVSNGVVLFAVAAMLTANPFWATVLLGVGLLRVLSVRTLRIATHRPLSNYATLVDGFGRSTSRAVCSGIVTRRLSAAKGPTDPVTGVSQVANPDKTVLQGHIGGWSL